ncbi:type III pantothenate kinase [Geojedonia litorea]|uniref:Type III pantothenate kinase n=1 Tax=Geojedonia litorea TaxID=1268269 RepID=A0ABV9N4W6_9FLAO
MNLIIDIGNTLVKLAVFHQDNLLHKLVCKPEDIITEVQKLIDEFPKLKKGIISKVGKLKSSELEKTKNQIELLELNSKLKLPFKNLYATPDTLGVDRIALVSASVKQFPFNNVLIIDTGTCITYDFISSKNEYFGGAISPGIRLRYYALHNLTANLPLLDTEMPNNLIGDTTSSSIHSGVVFGVVKEIDGVIEEYQKKYSDLTVILTGGDANFLSNQLKNSIFANSNFLLEGLNFILEFNSD